jgi:uncharacterized protein
MKGAGGTSGGVGSFFIGIAMMCGGFYMLFNAIRVNSNFGMGSPIYGFHAGGYNVGLTSGMVMIPFIFGVGILFYNAKNIFGWILSMGSLVALIFGVISSLHFSMKSMSSFDLIIILVLCAGGLGIFLKSLRNIEVKK